MVKKPNKFDSEAWIEVIYFVLFLLAKFDYLSQYKFDHIILKTEYNKK